MEEVIMPILNTDSGSSKKEKPAPVEETTRTSKDSSTPALPFMERIEAWLQDAGPREQLFAVALDLMLARKETIKKVTGRDVYKDMIDKYQDTVCRIAGGQENLDKADDEDEAMAAALAAIVTFS
jgi:hypothetical protein